MFEVRLPLARAREDGSPWKIAAALGVAASAAAIDCFASGITHAIVRTSVGAGLVVLAHTLIQSARGTERTAHGEIVIHEGGIRIEPRGFSVTWTEPFGLSVLSSPQPPSSHASHARRSGRAERADITDLGSRSYALLITTPHGAQLIPVESDQGIVDDSTDMLASLASAEGAGSWIEPGISRADADALLHAVITNCPRAVGRVVTSDALGSPITLGGSTLSLGSTSIDLAAPLDYRHGRFQERGVDFGFAFEYVAIASGERSVVFVTPAVHGGRAEKLPLDAPPPRDARIAVPDYFIAPLLRLLARAPRNVRPSAPSVSPSSSRMRERRA